jgi:hypothetical protein
VVEKIWNFEVSELFLQEKKKKKSWTRSTGHGPRPALVHGGLQRCGLERSGMPAGAREAVERRRDDDEGDDGGALTAGSLGPWREGKEGRGSSGEERGCQTGRGIGWPMVGHHYCHPVRWGEEAGGEWGVKRGKCGVVSERGGDVEVACAH